MKKKVTYKPNKWDQDDFQTYKMTLRKQYEVLQESEKLYLVMSDHGNQRWFMKKCFDVVEPKTPCPSDWQPSPDYSVSDYEAECLDSKDCMHLTIGKMYELVYKKGNTVGIMGDDGNLNHRHILRFATPTIRASAKPKETEQPKQLQPDPVNHNQKSEIPHYYSHGGITPDQIIEAKQLGWYLGNVVKYITRAGRKSKETEIEDLIKAKNNIIARIKQLERLNNTQDGKGTREN